MVKKWDGEHENNVAQPKAGSGLHHLLLVELQFSCPVLGNNKGITVTCNKCEVINILPKFKWHRKVTEGVWVVGGGGGGEES